MVKSTDFRLSSFSIEIQLMYNKLHIFKVPSLMNCIVKCETVMTIKIINISITPKCFLTSLMKPSLPVLHFPSRQSLICFVLL